MWSTLGGLLLVAYLPGAMLFRVPAADRVRRAALPFEERVFWAVILAITWSSAVALTLAVAGAYRYGRLLSVNVVFCLLVMLVARRRLRYDVTVPKPGPTALIPVALVALGLWLFFPPAEYVMGGKDPGTYMNEGIQIAQRGALVVNDPVVASVPPPLRDLFFPSHKNPAYYGLRFMGFFILDPDTGAVLGQFPHLYPVWIAIGYGLAGLTGARQAVSVWSILALLAVYFAGTRWLGRWVAAAGTTLLALNVIEVWFARYPNAEVVMQALLFAALLAYTRAHADGDRFFAPVAGILLGLLLFLRFDAVLAIAGVAAAAVVDLLEGRRLRGMFVVPLVLTLALAWFYLTMLMTPYAAYPLGFLNNLGPLQATLVVTGALAVIATGIFARAAHNRMLVERVSTWLPHVLTLGVLLAAAYAFFVRSATGRTAIHDAMALRTYAWYVTPPGLAAALLGYALVARRTLRRNPVMLTTATVFAFFFFYKIRIVPEHFWMARRFLPVILPSTLLLIAAAAFSTVGVKRVGAETGRRLIHLARLTLALVFIGLLGWQFQRASRPILHHVEHAGLIPRIEKLAGRFDDNDLVIVESRNSSDMHVLALPLAYIYARNVLVLNTPRPDKTAFRDFLAWARTKYREVFFIGGGGTDLLSRSIAVAAVESDRFQIPEYESATNAYPQGVRQKEFDYGIYRFVPPRPDTGWFELDIGTMDDLHVVRFHAKERNAPGDTFRWTRDVSYISILAMREDSRLVTIWLNDGRRPPTIDKAQATMYLNDRLIGHTVVTPGFTPYSFAIPVDVAAEAARSDEPARLKIVTNTWNPRAALGTPDDRQLGVMVDRIEVK